MASNLPPTFYDVYEPYFRGTGADASLCDFVTKHTSFIVANHKLGDNVANVWTIRYTKAYNFYVRETGATDVATNKNQKKPNWGLIAMKIVERPAETSDPNISGNDLESVSTGTNSTSETAASLTKTFFDQFRATHEAMNNEDKWTLPSGAVLEDVMFEFGLTCAYEHPCHSFIFDIDDPVWQGLFKEKEDREALVNERARKMPDVKHELKEYLDSYTGKDSFKALIDHARSQHFDVIDNFDMDWAQHTMETALRLYPFPGKHLPLRDQTESDILKRLWVFIDKAFDDTPLDVHSGEMESRASSDRRNEGRVLGDRKVHGRRTDLLLKCTVGEFGCCEAGKRDEGEFGTKERVEGGLKVPKMMKDMMRSLSSTSPTAKGLQVIGFIIMGMKLILLKMDRPSKYTCRLSRSKPKFFPSTLESFTAKMGSLVALVWQAKQVVRCTFDTIQIGQIEGATMSSSLISDGNLPPCPASPPPRRTKKQRVNS